MIGVLGISYKTAPLTIRERFSFTKEQIVPFSDLLQQEADISDFVLVSTCNRTEIYFSQDKYDNQTAFELVYEMFRKFKAINEHYWQYFYHRSDAGAVRHLFEVVSGLDSMIIGEDQIIGQVKEAYLTCTELALTDAILMRLFQKSFEAGKRVRTETGIKLGITSISSAAVEMCADMLNGLTNRSVLLVGASETGNLALQNIYKKGVRQITVTNRTAERADETAEKFDGSVIPFGSFDEQLHRFDIVMVATTSTTPIVTREMVHKSIKARAGEKQVYIDLSAPRNIESSVAQLDNVELFGIDELAEIGRQTAERKKESAKSAHLILDEVVVDFVDWQASRALRPAIRAISSCFQPDSDELSAFSKQYSTDLQQIAKDYGQYITQRYSRMLIKNLKKVTDNGKNSESLKIISDLFDFK